MYIFIDKSAAFKMILSFIETEKNQHLMCAIILMLNTLCSGLCIDIKYEWFLTT